jgi:2-iminobutanoate/2-iminopropanoate deaminase
MRTIKSLVSVAAIILSFSAAAESRQKKDPPAPASAQSTPVEYQSAANPSARTLSDFVRVGNILYLSGKLGTDSTGNLAPGGIGPETKQTMENIKAVLEKNGSSMDHVIKCTVMLTDIKEWADMNTVYVTFFKKERLPARSALGVSGLVRNARVEIECMATLK